MAKIEIKSELDLFKEKSIGDIFIDNKELLYPALFYIAGLLLGSFLYSYSSDDLNKLCEALFKVQNLELIQIVVNRFCVYFSIYSLTVLLGMCLIGFPFINLIPLICGVLIGLKLSYYYLSFSAKGVGYSLLMIVPESAAFITILIYAIKLSLTLSKGIYANSIKKSDMIEVLDFKSYLKSFLIYGFMIAGIAFINGLLTYLFSSIIKF